MKDGIVKWVFVIQLPMYTLCSTLFSYYFTNCLFSSFVSMVTLRKNIMNSQFGTNKNIILWNKFKIITYEKIYLLQDISEFRIYIT